MYSYIKTLLVSILFVTVVPAHGTQKHGHVEERAVTKSSFSSDLVFVTLPQEMNSYDALDPYEKAFSDLCKKNLAKTALTFSLAFQEGYKKGAYGYGLSKNEKKAFESFLKKQIKKKSFFKQLEELYSLGEFMGDHPETCKCPRYQKVATAWKKANLQEKGKLIGFFIGKRGIKKSFANREEQASSQ